MDVRHLGAADALVDPADHIAQDALGVVVELLLNVGRVPVRPGQRRGQQRIGSGLLAAPGHGRLHRRNVHIVVVQGVQHGRRGRGHPGRVGPGLRVADLGGEHGGHLVRRGPHALADLGAAGEARGQADLDVALLIGRQPGFGADRLLAHHGAGFHRGVDLVARAVQEAGVDEHDPRARGVDAGGEVGAGAALLVHDAQLDGVARQAQRVLDEIEQAHGKCDLVRPMHLGLHHIDRTRGAVLSRAPQVVQGGGDGDEGVEHRLEHRMTFVERRIAQHVVADVAHQHQAAAAQRQRALERRVAAVLRQPPGLTGAAFRKGRGEVAAHQAQPVAVDARLVFRVDRGDGVLAVLDRREGGFHQHVGDAGRVVLADRMAAVDLDLQVKVVVADQHGARRRGLALVADELAGIGQDAFLAALQAHDQAAVADQVGRRVGMRAGGERRRLVEHLAGIADHLGAADRIVALAAGRRLQGVGAVQGVVEAAPAGVGGIEREAAVGDRHHQLRSGQAGDLRIDAGGCDLKRRRLGQQVADAFEECVLLGDIERLALPPAPPGVDLGLQVVPAGQQGGVSRCEVGQDPLQRRPEFRGLEVEPGQELGLHEGRQDVVDRKLGGNVHGVLPILGSRAREV